ncbi:9810_t:CDS:1, partial [Entrophospora sp. SA101]
MLEFLKRLNMGTDKLTGDDLNEDEQGDDEHDSEEELYHQLKMNKKDNLALALQKKIDEI